MKQVILFDHEPWTQTRKKIFFDLFESAGIPLKVFDVSNYLYKGYQINGSIENAPYLTKISNEKQLIETCKTIKKGDIIILECFKRWNSRKIYKIIREKGAKLVKLELYGNSSLEKTKSDYLKRITLRRTPIIVKNRFQNLRLKLYFKLHKINDKFDYVISSSSLDSPDFYINHPDYEKYKYGDTAKPMDGAYFVFCDIFFPLHPDIIYFERVKHLPDASKYRAALKVFFDSIEEKYGIPVVIAAHPKSDYSGEEFGGRRIIKYQTENLIRHSVGVIMHLSNSVSFALLNDKPILFIATDDLMKTGNIKAQFKLMAEDTLGLNILNIDHEISDEALKFHKVKDELRKDYIYTFLTSEKSAGEKNTDNIKFIFEKILAE